MSSKMYVFYNPRNDGYLCHIDGDVVDEVTWGGWDDNDNYGLITHYFDAINTFINEDDTLRLLMGCYIIPIIATHAYGNTVYITSTYDLPDHTNAVAVENWE